MARHRHRHRSDAAGFGPDPKYTDDLVSIADLKDYRIVSGQADIRGWDVRTLTGRKVGDVDDLLIDTGRGEVVMVDVDLKDTDRHAEVPIRNVQIDRERKCVVIDSADLGVYEGEPAPAPPETRTGVTRDGEEIVVERRPMVEEVVVRRKPADPDEE